MVNKAEKLLNISRAAELLGVHPLTVRNWADKDYIPYYRTPGGHRRFRLSELEAFQAQMGGNSAEAGLVTVAQQAVREKIAAQQTQMPPSVVMAHQTKGSLLQENMSDQQRATMRTVGRDLLGLVIQYAGASTSDEVVLNRGRDIGRTYGQFARQQGVAVSEMVETFNFFRDTIIEVTFSEQAASAEGMDTTNPQLYRRLNQFMNEVLLATIQAIEGRDD
ncbi:MAG: helix-turn-helix domain-containing protein [Chloroflexota bacterium]